MNEKQAKKLSKKLADIADNEVVLASDIVAGAKAYYENGISGEWCADILEAHGLFATKIPDYVAEAGRRHCHEAKSKDYRPHKQIKWG